MPRRKKEKAFVKVLTGSELNGPDESIERWLGIEVPDSKWDAYVELVSGVRPLEKLFVEVENGFFEVTETEDDMGPGMNDTYWSITSQDPEALRTELRELLTRKLRLPKRKKGH